MTPNTALPVSGNRSCLSAAECDVNFRVLPSKHLNSKSCIISVNLIHLEKSISYSTKQLRPRSRLQLDPQIPSSTILKDLRVNQLETERNPGPTLVNGNTPMDLNEPRCCPKNLFKSLSSEKGFSEVLTSDLNLLPSQSIPVAG